MQKATKHSDQNITSERTAKEMALHIWSLVSNQVKQVKPAAVVIALFVALLFTFAVKANQRQNLTTAMLPVESVKTEAVQADSAQAAAALAPAQAEEKPSKYVIGEELHRMPVLPPEKIDTGTLWMARVIYSETKKPEEQELVAWVVRNRKETEYRGKDTYKEIALDPYQFSAFIQGTRTRNEYTSLTPHSKAPGWQNALSIAKEVKEAPDSLRPFPETTRHFYSQQSMAGGRAPAWARGKHPVKPERPVKLNARRFRFYAGVG